MFRLYSVSFIYRIDCIFTINNIFDKKSPNLQVIVMDQRSSISIYKRI
jgi:hypothetical protein